MAHRVLAYARTGNLGDAVQTVALSRLLRGPLAGVYRHRAAAAPAASPAGPLVVNGWLGDPVQPLPDEDDHAASNRGAAAAGPLFAGVHLGLRPDDQLRWLRRSPHPIGARDPATYDRLTAAGLPAEMVGCATLTLDRYSGPRRGVYAVDADSPGAGPGVVPLTNRLVPDALWPDQWAAALALLDRLRSAALVYTTRLHVAAPCVALGTPVVVARSAVEGGYQPDRFTLLDAVGFRYDEPFVGDARPLAVRYARLLRERFGLAVRPGQIKYPEPVGPP